MLRIDPSEHLFNSDSSTSDDFDHVVFMEHLVHDMRSLLAPIQGFAEIIALSGKDDESINISEIGKVIVTQSDRLGKIIEDALMCTRIMEKRLEISCVPVRISPMLDSLNEELQNNNEKTIHYENKLGDCIISGDLFYLRDALMRVIDNAMTFAKSQVSITSFVDQGKGESWASICIEDDGVGIAETDLPTIFEFYNRKNNPHPRGSSGNGMSLFIVRTILSRHQAKIKVESSPGKGTLFVFNFPVLRNIA